MPEVSRRLLAEYSSLNSENFLQPYQLCAFGCGIPYYNQELLGHELSKDGCYRQVAKQKPLLDANQEGKEYRCAVEH